MRLIDLDKLIADIKDSFSLRTDTDDGIRTKERVCGRRQIVKFIESYQPIIDAVPVVRCRKCKHWRCYGRDFVLEKDYGRCEKPDNESLIKYNASPYDDWFCADGKRKGGDE